MAQDGGVGWVNECIEVEVWMCCQHDRCGGVEGYGDETRSQRRLRSDGERSICNHSPGISFKGIIEKHEGDGAVVVVNDCPVALVIAHGAAMERVGSVVLVGCDVVGGLIVESEGGILHSTCVATDYNDRLG